MVWIVCVIPPVSIKLRCMIREEVYTKIVSLVCSTFRHGYILGLRVSQIFALSLTCFMFFLWGTPKPGNCKHHPTPPSRPEIRRWARNFFKSDGPYIGRVIIFLFPTYFFIFPSYFFLHNSFIFLHISFIFLHIFFIVPSYFFIFLHISFIFLHISFLFLHIFFIVPSYFFISLHISFILLHIPSYSWDLEKFWASSKALMGLGKISSFP